MKSDCRQCFAVLLGGVALVLSAFLGAAFLLSSPVQAEVVRSEPEQEVLTYVSEGQRYIMKKYTPGVVYLNPYTRGDYRIEDYAQAKWNVSFDYDDVKDEFTLYGVQGTKRLRYHSDHEIEVEEQQQEKTSSISTYSDANADHVFRNASGASLPAYVARALQIFRATDEYERGELHELYQSTTPDGGQEQPFLLEKNAIAKEHAQDVYRPRWKMVPEDDEGDWISFDYNPDTDYFTMYDPLDDSPYAKRRFVSLTQIDTVKYRDPGAETGTYNKESDGCFYGPAGRGIWKFVTDGMLIFYTQLRK